LEWTRPKLTGRPLRRDTSPIQASSARGIGMIYNVANRTPWDANQAWKELRRLSGPERVAALADPETRARLIADSERMHVDPEKVFVLPEGDARYDCRPEHSLAAIAGARGVSPVEAFIDLAVASGGATNLNYPVLNQSFDAVQEMLDDKVVTLGLADAGAHVGQIMDSSQPTYFLTHWVRDQQRWTLAEAIRRLTSDTADLFGIAQRGRLVAGSYADVNVIDLAGMRLPQPEFVNDFPNGAGRYIQRATGYDYTVVNGQVFMDHGEHAGALSGVILRS
jgi:N-acyl-D-aspartate/D-glutamate deacylase